jgi:integrase
MATPHPGLYKKGRYWQYIIQAHGQRAHGSTRATDLATARKVLEEKRRALIDGQLKRPTRIIAASSLISEWLRVNRATFSRGYLSSAECALRLWVMPVIGTLPVTKVTTSQVMELRARMLEAGCSATYANNTMKTLKAIFNFGIRMKYAQEIPFHLPKLKVQKQPRAIVPANRVHEFLEAVDKAARNPHIPVIIRVMFGLGLREAEVLGMRWEWFDPEQRTYVVGKAKGKEARVIPVPDWVWIAIHEMPKPVLSEWVFPAEDGKPHRSQFTKKALQKVCGELGVGNITAHRLRASFASLHAEAGTPVTEIQGMLGHKNIATTMIYVETSLDAKRKAQDALSQKLRLA